MALSKENSCAFYVSDYHLEMIMLPYINKNLEENKNVYVFTQNNLEETMNTLIDRVNLKDTIKEKLLNINWKIDDEDKYNKLLKDNKETIIFVKGNEKYIEKINSNLAQVKSLKNMEVIDCYNLNEIKDNINIIAKHHKNVLKTNDK